MAFKSPFRRYTRWSRSSASDENALRLRVEQLERAGGGAARQLGGVPLPLPEGPETFWIEIDGTPGDPTDGYTAWHQVGFADDGTTVDLSDTLEGAGELAAFEINDVAVAAGMVCLATLTDEEGSVLFVAPAGGGGATITVEAADGSPSYPTTGILQFDEADGFALSQPVAGTVKVKFSGGGGGGTLTVKAVDGTPSYSTVTEIRLDEADGFSLSQPAGGVARFDLLAATAAQAGIVSTTGQHFGGLKEFDNGLGVLTGVGTHPSFASGVVLDARGSAALAGQLYFNWTEASPLGTNSAQLLYQPSSGKTLSLITPPADYTSGTVGGINIEGTNRRFVLRYKTTQPCYSFYNEATVTYTDGVTGTGGGGDTFVGGLCTALGAGGGGGGTGTVTSIATGTGLTGGPISTSGTISLVIPVAIASGGTNSTTALSNNRIMTSQAGAIKEAAALTNGQLLIGSTGAAPVAATLTAGTGVTITNGAGTISIAASGGGVPTSRTISTTAPLTGGGDLSADRTFAISPFTAAGASHASGAVPDPGTVARSNHPLLLGDDAAFHKLFGELLGSNYVATGESTSSGSFVDLATVQSLTVVLDEVCDVVVFAAALTNNNVASSSNAIAVNLDGVASSITATNCGVAGSNYAISGMIRLSASSGTRVFKLQFRAAANTETFLNRGIFILRAS